MSILPSTLDYTDLDFESLRARLISLVRSVFPTWTDFDAKNFGTTLIELFSFVGDVNSFYVDAQANEAYLPTVTQRRNMIALAKAFGYRLPQQTPASVDVVLTFASPLVGNLLVTSGRTFSTVGQSPVRFQVVSPVLLLAGATGATLSVENSETQRESFTASGPGQEIRLRYGPYVDGTLTFRDSTAAPEAPDNYTEILDLMDAGPTDKVFTVSVDDNGRAYVRFGNNENGAVPSGTLVATYRAGGGIGGNVDAGTVVVADGTYQDTSGRAVRVTVTNPERASGGSPRESIERARQKAPASLRTLERAVATEDFETGALEVPGVSRALMLTSDNKPGLAENTGQVVVIPTGGGAPSSLLKEKVKAKFGLPSTQPAPLKVYKLTTTFSLSVGDPTFKTVDVSTVVHVLQGQNKVGVATAVKAALVAFFATENADGSLNANVDFGGRLKNSVGAPDPKLAWGDVHSLVEGTAGVRKVDAGPNGLLLNGDRADVLLQPEEFPRLGTVVVYDGETGGVL